MRRLPIRTLLVLCFLLPQPAFPADPPPVGAKENATSAPTGTQEIVRLRKRDATGPPSVAAPAARALPWLSDLRAGYDRAVAERKPVLVRVATQSCPWCRKLEEEIARPETQEALARWALVSLDGDRLPSEADSLAVEGVPALRILTATGLLAASHDGYLAAPELKEWLDKYYEAARAAPDETLLATEKPNLAAAIRLVRLSADRNPAAREAAIRRLLSAPDAAMLPVVKAFREGNLASRLGAMEVLRGWGAPLEGLDPWRPETFTEARLAALDQWAEARGAAAPAAGQVLSEAELKAVREELDRLARVEPAEAEAISERLARLGPPLLAEVYRRLGQAAGDAQRERLLSLRYRLVAAPGRALSWPGGLARLAATDVRVRQQAADELARQADLEDEPLLLELFSDPDPLVREISLRGLQAIGGKEAAAALVKLLEDPAANVRAAVLKQLAESPSPALASRVAAYVKQENDADLVVHAVRVLRAAGGKAAIEALVPLLKHDRWQVRAEAAEALAQIIGASRYGESKPEQTTVDAYVALIDLLNDADAFVVSRAVTALEHADMAVAVDPLVAAARKHPDLAATIVKILAESQNMRSKALPHLRAFARHDHALIRAAALRGLATAAPGAMNEELQAGLNDAAREVRIAAADAVLAVFETDRQAAVEKLTGRGADPFSVSRGTYLSSDGPFSLAASVAASVLAKAWKGEDIAETKDRPEKADSKATIEFPWEAWLEKHHARQAKSPLVADCGPLEKMLRAEDAEERLAAAAALVPLGLADLAYPVLERADVSRRAILERAARVLPWLTWDKRRTLFQHLRSDVKTDEGLALLLYALDEAPDPRLADLDWEILADPKLTAATAETLRNSLRTAYLGDSSDGPQAEAGRRRLAEAAGRHAASGGEWQRLVALALLTAASQEEAASTAASLSDDPKLPPALRIDAFQVALAVEPEKEAVARAIASLKQNGPPRRKLAMKYLACGRSALRELRGAISLEVPYNEIQWRSTPQPIVPVAPRGVRAEDLRPLAADSDPETRACAGYLLALLGDRQGLEVLVRHWRDQENPDTDLDRLVYRAVAALDDASQLAVLDTIYKRLDEYRMGDFYWTIRIMSGPEILRFRKRIRDEVGMEKLR